MIAPLMFALALFAAYDVPIPYGYAIHKEALKRGVSPFDVGAILMGESKGRRYLAGSTGRYGATAGTRRAERGLFQIAPGYWPKKCGIARDELFEPFKNIACAVVVIATNQDASGLKRRRRGLRWAERFDEYAADPHKLEGLIRINRGLDWRTHYRCHPRHRTSVGCARSVKRVVRMQRRLNASWNRRHTLPFWLVIAAKSGKLLVRTLGVSWLGAFGGTR